jgi:hypothetical protein
MSQLEVLRSAMPPGFDLVDGRGWDLAKLMKKICRVPAHEVLYCRRRDLEDTRIGPSEHQHENHVFNRDNALSWSNDMTVNRAHLVNWLGWSDDDECMVCMREMSDISVVQVICNTCGKSVCQKCALELSDLTKVGRVVYPCPVCRSIVGEKPLGVNCRSLGRSRRPRGKRAGRKSR